MSNKTTRDRGNFGILTEDIVARVLGTFPWKPNHLAIYSKVYTSSILKYKMFYLSYSTHVFSHLLVCMFTYFALNLHAKRWLDT
jgi:hypothetical protein